jgi:protein-tyrosine-phosphatase/DNA-binding transcriptional ArsR family regulator
MESGPPGYRSRVQPRPGPLVIPAEPPPVLSLVGHPVRWRLLRALVRSDRTVRELTALLDERQSLVSYHLGKLRSGEVVRVRRSAADGRDSYYALDLARCDELLHDAGGSLHPGLRFAPAPRAAPPEPVGGGGAPGRHRVLFLCTGNSARSQIAEGLTEHLSLGAVVAESAGSRPKPLHPNAVLVMKRRGIDISANRTKHLDEFVTEPFDAVITLCDRVREVCPEFPGAPALVHWSVPEPDPNRAAFERTADELATRIRFLMEAIDANR